MLGTAFVVGFIAQRWKGRTGAIWFFLTLIVEVFAFLVLQASWLTQNGEMVGNHSPPSEQLAMVFLSCATGFVIVGLIVASLPKTGRAAIQQAQSEN
jgi:biotin transporter BioY